MLAADLLASLWIGEHDWSLMRFDVYLGKSISVRSPHQWKARADEWTVYSRLALRSEFKPLARGPGLT
jgi:hypothetical protein